MWHHRFTWLYVAWNKHHFHCWENYCFVLFCYLLNKHTPILFTCCACISKLSWLCWQAQWACFWNQILTSVCGVLHYDGRCMQGSSQENSVDQTLQFEVSLRILLCSSQPHYFLHYEMDKLPFQLLWELKDYIWSMCPIDCTQWTFFPFWDTSLRKYTIRS